jgi:hypothetical protein
MSPGYDVLNVSVALADLLMEMYLGIRHFPSRDLVTSKGCLHPCRQASFFLPCARPPDVPRLCLGRPRNHQAAYVRRAFVLTRLAQTPEFTRCHLGVAIAATPMMFLSLLLELLPADFVTDIYALAALKGLHLSSSARYERAYLDLMTYINEGHAITLEQVLKVGLKYSRDNPSVARTFAASRAHDDEVCNHDCPRCCTRGRSPHPSSRNSSRTYSRAGSPRLTRAFRTVHASKYWANLGLDNIYHTCTVVLEVNGINPHQVLLEDHIDNFGHQDAGDAIAAVAAKFPESDDSDLACSP